MVSKKRKPIINQFKSAVTGLCTHLGKYLQLEKTETPQPYGKLEAAGLGTQPIQEILCMFTSFLQFPISLQTVVGFVCSVFLNLVLKNFVTLRVCYCSKEMMLFFFFNEQ